MLSYESALKGMYAGVRERLATMPAPPKPIRLAPPKLPELPARVHTLLIHAMEDVGEAPPDPIGVPHFKVIMRQVSQKHGVSITDLKSERRDYKTVAARQEAAYRMRHETGMSLPQIGRRLGGRDHTTILHSVAKHQSRLDGVPLPPRGGKPPVLPTFWTQTRCEIAQNLRDQGMNSTQIAKAVGAKSGLAVKAALARARGAKK